MFARPDDVLSHPLRIVNVREFTAHETEGLRGLFDITRVLLAEVRVLDVLDKVCD